jgi:Protein of unknown function (DUF2510)
VTTEQTTRVVPAGWYQDPADDARVRWWNGITWTEHVESKPSGASAPAAPVSDDQRAAEARALQAQYDMSGDADVMSRRESIALDHRGPDTGTIPIIGVTARKTAPTGTSSAWLLAFTPLLTTVLAVIAAYVYFYVTPTPLVAASAVVMVLLGFLWAVGDAHALESRGLPHPSALVGLALPLIGPLVYLLLRRRKVDGSAPLIAFVALLLITVVGPLALGFAGGAQTITKALEVQLAVRADLVGTGAAVSVTCPPIVESTKAGSIFTCDAVLASGETVHVWVSFDDEAGNFSWALANR